MGFHLGISTDPNDFLATKRCSEPMIGGLFARYLLCFIIFEWPFSVRITSRADVTNSAVTTSGGTIFSSIKNNLKMQFVPGLGGKVLF